MNGEALGIRGIRDADAENYAGTEWFTAIDLNGDWETASATVISLKGDTAKVSGGGFGGFGGGRDDFGRQGGPGSRPEKNK